MKKYIYIYSIAKSIIKGIEFCKNDQNECVQANAVEIIPSIVFGFQAYTTAKVSMEMNEVQARLVSTGQIMSKIFSTKKQEDHIEKHVIYSSKEETFSILSLHGKKNYNFDALEYKNPRLSKVIIKNHNNIFSLEDLSSPLNLKWVDVVKVVPLDALFYFSDRSVGFREISEGRQYLYSHYIGGERNPITIGGEVFNISNGNHISSYFVSLNEYEKLLRTSQTSITK